MSDIVLEELKALRHDIEHKFDVDVLLEPIREELKGLRADMRHRDELLRREIRDQGEELRRRADAFEARLRLLEMDRKAP